MTSSLDAVQLGHLSAAFERGATDASAAMAQWLQVPSLITMDSLAQHPVSAAVDAFATDDEVRCFCTMSLADALSGHLVLSFDDASGLALSDLLLDRPSGTATEWTEVEQSAALESHNIIGCAYLNTLSTALTELTGTTLELVPSPPDFRQDFAAAFLDSLFVNQTRRSETVFLAAAQFQVREQPTSWTLMYVPNADAMQFLVDRLPGEFA